MLRLNEKNELLQQIKTPIEKSIAAHQTTSASAITDELRHDILNILVAYSDKIPHPASKSINTGNKISGTLIRWQILAYVSSIDLTLAKWFESHLDALSILHEVGYDNTVSGLWAIWAAEGHPSPLYYQQGKISGTKAWCSAANRVDHALMTYRDEHGHSQLVTVDMQQSGIAIDNSQWRAVGMQATDTASVQFDQVSANNVGAANAYLDRVGFWHGAAGVAACWYGAAAQLASYLLIANQQKPNDYKAMYLGQIGTALAVTRQYFYYVGELIDSEPQRSHELIIRELRSQVEKVSRLVIDSVGQALGAAPFCNNDHFARLSADLIVFIRQSHGAFDLQKIGELSTDVAHDLTDGQVNIWQL